MRPTATTRSPVTVRETVGGARPAPIPVGRGWGLALWIGLVFAFGPVLRPGIENLSSQPWTRGPLVFLLLAWVAARGEPAATRSRTGWLFVLLGIAIELVAIGGDVARAGRLGFVIAAVGLCRATGGCTLPVAFLLAFLVPLPHALMELGSPALESGFAGLAAGLARALGFEVASGRGVLSAGGATLRLTEPDGGLGLLLIFAGLAWFVELRAPSPSARSRIARGLRAGLAALALQVVAATLAAVALGVRADDAAALGRAILDHLPWLATWAAGIGLAWRYRPGDGTRSRGPIVGGG